MSNLRENGYGWVVPILHNIRTKQLQYSKSKGYSSQKG